MSVEIKIYLRIGALFGVVFLLSFLGAMFRREAVKQDLVERGCAPLHIWWIPFALSGGYRTTSFRVIYRDAIGAVHKARCYVSVSLMNSPFGQRRVKWTRDEVIEIDA